MSDIQDALIELAKSLISRFEGDARITFEGSAGDVQEPGIHLVPANSAAARVVMFVEDDHSVDLLLGMATRIEIAESTRAALLQKVETLLEPVIRGNFEERIMLDRKGRVLRSRSRLLVQGRTRRFYYNWLLPLPRFPGVERLVQRKYHSYRA